MIYDTNVMVSAVLKPGCIPASLVALALEKQVRLFISPEILDEYDEVLRRGPFLQSHPSKKVLLSRNSVSVRLSLSLLFLHSFPQ